MENYEKKYKEALETARKINSGEGVAAPEGWSTLEVIFPELKESEDERIRKEIIHLIKKSNEYGGYALHKDEADRMISWLEKQGKQKPTNKEPKFKVGDWVVRNYLNNTRDIDKVINVKQLDDETYGYYLEDNVYFSGCYEDEYHLWTIQDANDGDVLATKKGNPFIYDKNRYNNGLAYYYAGIDANEELTLKSTYHMLSHFGELSSVFPATKEQRDLLFQKMEEAGYKWDDIKKKLIRYES